LDNLPDLPDPKRVEIQPQCQLLVLVLV
jgi:hypothetical protein